ncbi:MAG: hypothetical protein WD249_07470 [Gaiellaceae bacterium]
MDSPLREVLDGEAERLVQRQATLMAATDADLVEQLFTLEHELAAHSDALRTLYDQLTATLTTALQRWAPAALAEAERRECGDA